jgi:methylmalonyl-CoA mutase
VLWSKITEAYQVAEELQGQMEISADTSWFTKTVYDPYVNLLRAGNEAFAAVLGGVQYLHVSPFDEPEGESSEFSERIARNTQLLLKNEARLGSIIDPAGGSWYIESLTDELAEMAWALFLEIDEKGGIAEVLESGWLQAQIEEVKAKRTHDIASRKQTIVGTNKYANPQDKPLTAQAAATDLVTDFIPVKQGRLAEPYEQLRQKAENLAQMNQAPVSGLLCLGTLKNHKARADFIDGFLAPGGIAAVRSSELHSIEDALTFINEKKCHFYVLCASDAQYAESGLSVVEAIRKRFPELKLYVAGLAPEGEEEAWKQAGVSDFITVKSNCYETLRSFLNEIEVEKVHE